MYTKGEWFNHNGTIETAYSPNGHVIALMNDIGGKVEADGNLIASAPELYEALKGSTTILRLALQLMMTPEGEHSINSMIEQNDKALSKAGGK